MIQSNSTSGYTTFLVILFPKFGSLITLILFTHLTLETPTYVELSMSENWNLHIEAHVAHWLTLRLVNGHRKAEFERKLKSLQLEWKVDTILLIHSLVFSLFFSLFFSYLFFLYGPRQEIPVQQDNWYPEDWDNNYVWTEPSYEIGPSERN
jgi:hypothetical protein